jgi:type VI protein secretion system component Hcp
MSARTTCILLAVALLACAAASAGEYRMYMKLPGVEGTATVGNEQHWIELESVKIGPLNDGANGVTSPVLSVSAGAHEGPDLASARIQDGMALEAKTLDKATPKLLTVLEQDQRFSPVMIAFVTSEGAVESKYIFSESIITSIVSEGHGARLTIQFSTVQR